MIKKILLGSAMTVITLGMVSISLLNFSIHSGANLKADENGYNFTNLSANNGAVSSGLGRGVAFDSGFNRVGYVSSDKGLQVGVRTTSGSYAFTSYTAANNNGISSDEGYGVSLYSGRSTIYVGYASYELSGNTSSGGLSIGSGSSSGSSLTFSNYNATNTPTIGSNDGRAVAFGSANLIGYASTSLTEGGLSIGRTTDGNQAGYTFEHFDNNTPGFGGTNLGRGVAFSADGNTVAYAGGSVADTLGGGLKIGKYAVPSDPDDPDWTFTSYTDEDEIGSRLGTSVAFDGNGDIAYGSAGGVSIATLSNDGTSYTFKNYNSSTSGIASNECRGVAFSSGGALAYADGSNSLSIGVKNSEGDYTFTNYTTSNAGISSSNGSGVAFGNNNEVLLSTDQSGNGGVSLGIVNAIAASFNLNAIKYNLRDNNRFNVSALNLSFNYPLIQNPIFNNYVKIDITNGSNTAETLYITRDGYVPGDSSSKKNTQPFRIDGDTEYSFSDLTADGVGFAGSTDYAVTAYYGNNDNNLTTIGSTNFTTDKSLVGAFNANQIEYTYNESSQTYSIQSINFGFTRSLNSLSGSSPVQYILIQITSNDANKTVLYNFYITPSGELPTNADTGNVPYSQARANDGTVYAVSNLGINLDQNKPYNVNYYLANEGDTTQTNIGGDGTFSTPTYVPPVPNLPSPTNGSSLGLAIGLGAGIPAAGVSLVGSYFGYRFLNRGRRNSLL